MSETIKVEVDQELARRFRKRAMEKYGYKKGSVKKAIEGLMAEFARDNPKKPDWASLVGAIKDDYKGMTSVELQHSIWTIKNDYHNRYKRIH
ncbi:MAG: hypothetical protein ACYC7D_08655 [Nitrososphaerales archaeon]